MTTTELTEHTVSVVGKAIFVAQTGTGPAVVMLHGGGPGASGVSNYSRNIGALAQHFRVIVPDMPGYGRSAKRVDQNDPFGYLADTIRGLPTRSCRSRSSRTQRQASPMTTRRTTATTVR